MDKHIKRNKFIEIFEYTMIRIFHLSSHHYTMEAISDHLMEVPMVEAQYVQVEASMVMGKSGMEGMKLSALMLKRSDH